MNSFPKLENPIALLSSGECKVLPLSHIDEISDQTKHRTTADETKTSHHKFGDSQKKRTKLRK